MTEIEKIIFIKDKKRVCIFYSDGTLKYMSVEEGKIELSSLARKENLNKEDVKNWDKIEFCSFEEFENKYHTEAYMRENRTKFLLQRKLEEDKRREKRRKKENKRIKRQETTGTAYRVTSILVSLGLLASTAVLGGGCYFLYNKFFNNNSQSNEANKDIEDTNADIKASNEISSIINDNDLNSTKRNFVSFLYEYLQNYNSVFANKHKDENTSTKPALTIEEVISQLLIYKDYDKKQLFDIFGYDNFSSEDIYKAYISGVEFETKAHIIQKESLNKNFIKGKKKDIFDKYEGLMISFNIQDTEDRKIELAKQFWTEIRNDINIENADKLPKNMEVILPIVKAMRKICKNLDIDEKLNSKEAEWYFTECDQRIREKLYNYEVELNDVATVNKRLGATVVMSITQIKDTIVNKLMSDGIYNIEDHERDISDYEEYKNAIKYFKKLDNNSNKDDRNSDIKVTSDDKPHDYDKQEDEEDKDNSKEKNKKQKTQKPSKKNHSKSKSQSESPAGESSNGDNYDDSYDDSDSNTNTNSETEPNDENYDADSNNDSYDSQEDEENKDNSYPDYVKDVTDDETGAYEDFPNLNSVNKKISKSDYADYIISNMDNKKTIASPKVKVKGIRINYK